MWKQFLQVVPRKAQDFQRHSEIREISFKIPFHRSMWVIFILSFDDLN